MALMKIWLALATLASTVPRPQPPLSPTDPGGSTVYTQLPDTTPADAAYRQKVLDALDARVPPGEEKPLFFRWAIRVPDSPCPDGVVRVMLARNGWGNTWLFASPCNTATQETLLTLAEKHLDQTEVPATPL